MSNTNTEVLTTAYEKLQGAITIHVNYFKKNKN